MTSASPEGLRLTEHVEEIPTMDHLDKLWSQALLASDTQSFDAYFEGLIHFHGNLMYLEGKTQKKISEASIFERRMRPIGKGVEEQKGKLDQSIFEKNKLTPADIRELFVHVDIDAMIASYRHELVSILGKIFTVTPWEAVVARSEGRSLGGNNTIQ